MRSPRLEFSRDVVPVSERLNPHASQDFDWGHVFAECDRELEQAVEGLDAEDRRQLAEALTRVLRWVYAVGPTGRIVPMDRSIGRRAIAIGLHLCPDAMPLEGQAATARALGISKQAMAKAMERAREAFPLNRG